MKNKIAVILLLMLCCSFFLFILFHIRKEKKLIAQTNVLNGAIVKQARSIVSLKETFENRFILQANLLNGKIAEHVKRVESLQQDFTKVLEIKGTEYKNEKYGFEISFLGNASPYTHEWEEKKHINMPRRLWDAVFSDKDFGVPQGHATGEWVIQITVNECKLGEDIDSCLAEVTSCCGMVPFKQVNKLYGKDSLKIGQADFRGYPARRMVVDCLQGRVDEGLAILRNNRLFTVLFLSAPEDDRPFPKEMAETMLSSFQFLEDKPKEQEIPIELLPDLVIKDIVYGGAFPDLCVEYCNQGKTSNKKEKFGIELHTNSGSFTGGSLSIPDPGKCEKTGSVTLGLIGVKEGGETKDVTAKVDLGNTVKEENEDNNTFTKTIEFYPTLNICQDSDGGKDFFVAGEVSIRTDETHASGMRDSCVDNISGSSSSVAESPYLNECYCENNKMQHIIYRCPQGCFRGACVTK